MHDEATPVAAAMTARFPEEGIVRVVLTGTYCSANKGDAAMEIATALGIRQRLPSVQITVATPFPDLDRALYRAYGMAVVRSRRRRLLWSASQLARCGIYGIVQAATGHAWRWLLLERELRIVADASLIIDLSGDMLTEDYGPHVAMSHFYPLLIALALNKPLYVCAQSIGPFRWTRPLARWLLERASRITVRDEISERYLDELGISRAIRFRTADTAFLLPTSPGRERMRALVGDEATLILGVSLSNLVASKWRPGGTRPRSRIDAFARESARMLDRVVEELGATIVFIPHVTGPKANKDDRQISREVREAMKCRSRAFVIEEDLEPATIKGVIAECTVVFGARMHANIAALSSGVPVVAIAYSHKTPGIMRSLGQGAYVLDIDELDHRLAFSMIEQSFTQRERRREILAQHLPAAIERASENFDDLATLLG